MTEPEYATFNDSPDKPPTEMEKAKAVLAKPWRQSTWNERLFKGAVNTLGFVAGALAATAASNATSRRIPSNAGWDNPPSRRPEPQSVLQQQPVFVPLNPNPFYNPYVGLADPVGMWRYMNGPQI